MKCTVTFILWLTIGLKVMGQDTATIYFETSRSDNPGTKAAGLILLPQCAAIEFTSVHLWVYRLGRGYVV